jgi:hypothetical protein
MAGTAPCRAGRRERIQIMASNYRAAGAAAQLAQPDGHLALIGSRTERRAASVDLRGIFPSSATVEVSPSLTLLIGENEEKRKVSCCFS